MYAAALLLIGSTAANADWINSIVNGTTRSAKERVTEKVVREFNSNNHVQKTFAGIQCNDDCEQYITGYEWAKEKLNDDVKYCLGENYKRQAGCLHRMERNGATYISLWATKLAYVYATKGKASSEEYISLCYSREIEKSSCFIMERALAFMRTAQAGGRSNDASRISLSTDGKNYCEVENGGSEYCQNHIILTDLIVSGAIADLN